MADLSNERTNDLTDRLAALRRAFPPGTAGRDAYNARREIDEIRAELRRREQAAQARKGQQRKGGH